MIEPAREDEQAAVCESIAAINPWKILGIRGEELAHGLQQDPLRNMMVYRQAAGASALGAIIYRQRGAAELLFFRGFGPALAKHHGLVAESCEWTDLPDAGYIGSLAVFPGNTGRGIGQQLLDAAHQLFMAAGHKRGYLMVSAFNKNARRFYERNGYQAIAHLDNCLRPGNREYLMEKVLEGAPLPGDARPDAHP